MTPRQGLWMALVGLVIGVVSVVPACVMPETAPGTPGGASDLTVNLIILGCVGGFVGLVVMIVGLIMAGVATLAKGSGK
jgi:hypothetical protein